MRFIRQLRDRKNAFPTQPVGPQSITTIIDTLLRALIRRSPNTDAASGSSAVQLMEFAYEIGRPGNCGHILSHLLNEPILLDASHVSKVLVPSVSKIMACLARHQVSPTSEPFAPYFKKVVLGYADLVLGRKPTDMTAQLAGVRRMACTCTSCTAVVAFFTSSSAPSLVLDRIGAPGVKHVEAELQRNYGVSVATCTVVKTTPRSLQVWSIKRFRLSCGY